MPPRQFKKIYTRTTGAQDVELYVVRPTFLLPNTPMTEMIYLGKDGKWEAWYVEDEYLKMMHSYADKVCADGWNLDAHLVAFEKDRDYLKATTHDLAQVSSSFSPEKAIEVYQKYSDAWLPYIEYIWIPWAITFVLDEWFQSELVKRYGEERGKEIYEILARCTKPIQMDRCIEELLQWKIDEEPTEQLRIIQQTYGHLGGYSVNDRYWNEDELKELVREFTDPKARLHEKQEARKLSAENADRIFQQLYRDDVWFYEVARTIHEYVFLRTERIDIYKWAAVNAGPFFRAFEEYFSLPPFIGGHLTRDEVLKALTTGEVPSAQEMEARLKKEYAIHFLHGSARIITEEVERAALLKERFKTSVDISGVSFLQGKVACTGKVQGKARVILHLKDVPKMQSGEILISNMTHPDYMPAIRKAAAIVTDEGGIVCHAAIISRELHIPCIIGTDQATQVFKTGDTVEVDATQGTVRRI